MTIMKGSAIIILILLLNACGNNLDLRIKYQRIPIIQRANITIYSYHLAWTRDAEAYYISANNDVCMGFDSTKDYCFGLGDPDIFYSVKGDTLHLYSTYRPTIPKRFPIIVQFEKLLLSEWPKYDAAYKAGKINKISFDTILHDIPCKRLPYTTARNMKFKRQ